MATDKSLVMYRYNVDTINGDKHDLLHAVAAYTQNAEGFLLFKNASHETVLMVNVNCVVSVQRGEAPAPSPQFVPAGYTADFNGNVIRTDIRETA